MKPKHLILILAVLLGIAGACKRGVVYLQDYQKYDHVVASVGDRFDVTMAQLYDSMYHSELDIHGVVDTALVRTFLDSMLCDTLAGLAAAEFPLRDEFRYWWSFRNRYRSRLVNKFWETTVMSKIGMDSTAIAEFYYSRPDLFQLPEQVRFSHIMVAEGPFLATDDPLKIKKLPPEELDSLMLAKVDSIMKRLDAGEDFSLVAEEQSHDETSNYMGGAMGWVGRGYYRHPFDSIAFSTPVGDISAPYRDQDGWHILRIEDHLEEGVPPIMVERWPSIVEAYRNTLSNQYGGEILDSLRGLPVEIEYNEPMLDRDVYALDPAEWMAVVNGQDTVYVNDLRTPEIGYRQSEGVPNSTAEMKRQMVSVDLLPHVLVYRAAMDMSIDTIPEVRRARDRLWAEQSRVVIEARSHDRAWIPPDSVARAYFAEHRDQYAVERSLSLVSARCDDSGLCAFFRDEVLAGGGPIEVADMIVEAGGVFQLKQLGWVTKADIPAEWWAACENMIAGDLTEPLLTDSGFVVLQVQERQDPRTYDQAQAEIRRLLKDERNQQVFASYRDSLYQVYDVHVSKRIHPIHLRPLGFRLPLDEHEGHQHEGFDHEH